MKKKIDFAAKPRTREGQGNADAWVENRLTDSAKATAVRERTKRLTIDVPASLHKRIKSQCAAADEVMADAIRDMLEQRFPEPGRGPAS
jgi:hypothetical protein